MTVNPESIPSTWTAADESFFRITSAAFSPAFLAGAGVLLASYDDEATAVNVSTTPVALVAPATLEIPAPTAL